MYILYYEIIMILVNMYYSYIDLENILESRDSSYWLFHGFTYGRMYWIIWIGVLYKINDNHSHDWCWRVIDHEPM